MAFRPSQARTSLMLSLERRCHPLAARNPPDPLNHLPHRCVLFGSRGGFFAMASSWAVRVQSRGHHPHSCRRSCCGRCRRTRSRALGHNHRRFRGRHHHVHRHRHFRESRKEARTRLVLGRIPFSYDGLIVVLAHPVSSWTLPPSYWAGSFGSSSWCWVHPRVHSLRRCCCWSHCYGVSSVWDQS